MRKHDTLVFTATYNEADNIRPLIEQLLALGMAADILVVDDNSPDGTGDVVAALQQAAPNLRLLRRPGKQGIGSAHLAALQLAAAEGYAVVVSMDADFSHSPADVPRLLALREQYDVIVGSRFQRASSLQDWNAFRWFMTHLGHFLTRTLLRLPYDASGGLRLYRLERISAGLLDRVESRDYAFFFESLTALHVAGLRIGELPVDLPARTYGHSKMRVSHMVGGLLRLLALSVKLAFSRRRYRAPAAASEPEEMRRAWDHYWEGKKTRTERSAYDAIASFYRNYLIKPSLERAIRRNFAPRAELIHAGCGGGEVDTGVVRYAKVTAVDISPNAVARYQAQHGANAECMVADIFRLSALGRRFDGVYNLGVMEHFEPPDIRRILGEFNRVLKTGGRIVIFWPPVYGLSVIALHAIHFVLNRVLRRGVQLHPPEPTKLRSRAQMESLLQAAGFELESISFGASDAFTYAVVTAVKRGEPGHGLSG